MPAEPARVVQISDTHLCSALPPPEQWRALVEWLAADPPDLVVHTGDIVDEDPDDAADRAFAKTLLDQVPVPYVVIPGNHDVGSFDDEIGRARRVDAFRATWGDDRFVRDLAGWRLVGIDTYLLDTPEHDEWLGEVLDVDRPVVAFVHQPLHGDQPDGWEMPAGRRAAFERATRRGDVRVVASGHRHCSFHIGPSVWAPSLTLTGTDPVTGADPRPGFVEHVLSEDGTHDHRVVRPWSTVTG